tara:strand:+ start:784 stop:1035 length:252 start_codon:yes stop_codon:yes gene_type:complete
MVSMAAVNAAACVDVIPVPTAHANSEPRVGEFKPPCDVLLRAMKYGAPLCIASVDERVLDTSVVPPERRRMRNLADVDVLEPM